MNTLIVIGGTGELGRQTVLAADAKDGTAWSGDIIATYNSTAPVKTSPRVTWFRLDCSDHNAVRELIASQPHLAAVLYCAVPKGANASAKQRDALRTGIVDDVLNCAEAVVMLGARFIAVSTDLVFDGTLPPGQTYAESDTPTPTNAYGKCKTEMERRLLGLSGHVVIARSSLILTFNGDQPSGKGVQFVIDCINGKHGVIEIFTDELRSMSFSDDMGRAMVELASPQCEHVGIIHLVSDETTNRWNLAQLLAKKLGAEHLLGESAKSGLSVESGLNRPLNCGLSAKLRKSVLKTKLDGISERLG